MLPMSCHKSRCVKLTMKVVTEKSIKLSESFSPVMENIKLPGSLFTGGSHFIFSCDGKLLVLCDIKKYYNSNGRYVVLFDLQNETLDFIDKEVRRLCLAKNDFVALQRDPKSPGRDFYTLDPSYRTWVNSSIQPLPTFDIKYPDMLAYSSLLLVISGSSLQVFVFDLQQWFRFKLVMTDDKIEASLTTTYTIMNDRLYICYTDKAELYYINIQEINDAIATQSQPARLMTLCPIRMLYPVNFISVHEDCLVALYINTVDKSIQRAWYYSEGCDHWHVITSFDPYIDGQWYAMEDGKAAVAKLSASWSMWHGWDITVKIHQVHLTED